MNSDVQASKALARRGSVVEAIDKQGQVFKGLQVWCNLAPAVKKDPNLLFAKCLVLPGSTKTLFRLKQVDPEDPAGTVFEVGPDAVYNTNQNIDPLSFPDIGMIPHTNIAAVLSFIRDRYVKGQIYVTAEPLLLAMNPFKDLGNATDAIIYQYRDSIDHLKLPPHVFSIARNALENLYGVDKAQTIIVSGESGAGKTEATKQIMRYFAAAKSGKINLKVQKAVLAGNPVLEAFGNAKTVRNNNSSRFGRFMQLQVAIGGGIEYGNVKNFLLEKSRIVTQVDDERSYHIFYQILKGFTAEEKKKYLIIDNYNYINMKAKDVTGIDDTKDLAEVRESFKSMGILPDEIESIFKCVSAIMLIGNVEIKGEARNGIPDAGTIGNLPVLETVCNLLELSVNEFKDGLFTKITAAGGGKEIHGVYTAGESTVLRNSLAKALYNNLFDWIVKKLNSNITNPEGFQSFIGMLDIFGFEVFKNNSLEQLFINITNEMLQKNFVDVVFDKELNLYRSENVSTVELKWTTNAPIIELLTNKRCSIISNLEDTCMGPAPDDKKFVSTCNSNLLTSKYYAKAKISSDINFVITHTIGDIAYCATSFIDKNKDLIKPQLVDVMKDSKSQMVRELFADVVVVKGKMGKNQLISAVFIDQLRDLMEIINSTEPHFIRCLKPNEEKAALKFVSSKVLVQLHALSIIEALQLRNLGYSYRRPFDQFRHQFKFLDLGVSEDKSLDNLSAVKKLLEGTGLGDKDYQIGRTMIFLKHDALKILALRQRELLAVWSPLVSVLEAMYKAYKFRENIKSKIPSLIRVQAHIRANVARRSL